MSNRQDLPSYNEIFEQIKLTDSDESRSVLSPAAYFVDLMLLKENATDVLESIDERRPEISGLPLDYESTYKEIPYLDIVNEVMAHRIEKELKDNPDYADNRALEILKHPKTVFPYPAPFNKDYHELRGITDKLHTDLVELYKTFAVEPDVDQISRDYLGISKEIWRLITTSDASRESICARWGLPADEDPVFVLRRVKTFQMKLGIDEKQVDDLLFQDLSEDEIADRCEAEKFFIHPFPVSDRPTNLEWVIWEIHDIYDEVYRHLAKVLSGDNGVAVGTVVMVQTTPDDEKQGLTKDELIQLADSYGLRTGSLAMGDDDINGWFECQLTKAEYKVKFHSRKMIRDVLANYPTGPGSTLITTQEALSDYAEKLEVIYKSKPEKYFNHLSLNHLDRIIRFVVLSKITKWSFSDCDLVLRTACNKVLDARAIQKIAAIQYFHKMFGLPIDALCSFWADMKNWGEGAAVPNHMFYRVFHKGMSMSILAIGNKSIDNPEIKNRLQGSLNLTEKELEILLSAIPSHALFGNDSQKNINLSNLSALYRYVTLANALNLKVDDFMKLFNILEKNGNERNPWLCSPFIPIDVYHGYPIHQVLCNPNQCGEEIFMVLQILINLKSWLVLTGLTVSQFMQLCSQTTRSAVDAGLMSSSDQKELLEGLENQIQPFLVTAVQLQSPRFDSRAADRLFFELYQADCDGLTREGLVRRIPGTSRMESIVQKVLGYKYAITASDLSTFQWSTEQFSDFLTQMQAKGYVAISQERQAGNKPMDPIGILTDAGLELFSSKTVSEFDLVGYDGQKERIFETIAVKAKALYADLQYATDQATEIRNKLAFHQDQQQDVVYNFMSTKTDLPLDNVKPLCRAVYTVPGEQDTDIIDRVMTPILQDADGNLAEISTNLYRMLQLSLMTKNMKLTPRQTSVFLTKSKYRDRKLEKINFSSLGADCVYRTWTRDENKDFLFIAENGQYGQYSHKDYSLLASGHVADKAWLSQLVEKMGGEIPVFLNTRDKGIIAFGGTQYFLLNSGEGSARPITDFGLPADTRVYAAIQAADGKVLLFYGNENAEYACYSSWDGLETGTLKPDPGYPRTVRDNIGTLWPENYQGRVDGIFPFEGRLYIILGETFLRFSDKTFREPDLDELSPIFSQNQLSHILMPDENRNVTRVSDHFDGLDGEKPVGWRDITQDTSFNAAIVYSGTPSWAKVTRTSQDVWGKVLSPTVRVNVDTTPCVEISVKEVSADCTWKIGVQEMGGSWRYWDLAPSSNKTGIFGFDLRTLTELAGDSQFAVQIAVEGAGGVYIQVDWFRIGDSWSNEAQYGYLSTARLQDAPLHIHDLIDAANFRNLTNKYNSNEWGLIQYFEKGENNQETLCKATGWDGTQLTKLLNTVLPNYSNLTDISTIARIDAILSYCQKLGSTPQTILDSIWPDIFNETGDIATANNYLFNRLKSMSSETEWETIAQEHHKQLNRALRDALLPYLLHLLGLENGRQLYSELLIDIEMSEEALTTRIAEAIAAAQLYYHRVLNNLEIWQATKTKLNNLKRWWGWMKNYRVWEANRKVFLYPENYIRPELRSSKSPEFESLEESLLQMDITDETVEMAYKKYLEEYAKISSLIIAGGCVYNKEDGNFAVMFGRSRLEPVQYYYRVGEIPDRSSDPIAWAPWQQIKILINAERVYPVYAFNKIFIFWLEYLEMNETQISSGTDINLKDSKITYDPVVYYSFYDMKKEWKNPQKLFQVSNEFINVNGYAAAEYWTKDELKKTLLQVNNPIANYEYSDEEMICVEYLGSIPLVDRTINIRGKLTSELRYQTIPAIETEKIMGILNDPVAFPVDFGFTPTSSITWQRFYTEGVAAPWFSFDHKGGNFLCRPDKIPTVTSDKIVYGKSKFKDITNIDAGFDYGNQTHLFRGSEYIVYDRSTGHATAAVDIEAHWGNVTANVSFANEQVQSAFVLDGITYIITTNYIITYNSSDYVEFSSVASVRDFKLPLAGYKERPFLAADARDRRLARYDGTDPYRENNESYQIDGQQYFIYKTNYVYRPPYDFVIQKAFLIGDFVYLIHETAKQFLRMHREIFRTSFIENRLVNPIPLYPGTADLRSSRMMMPVPRIDALFMKDNELFIACGKYYVKYTSDDYCRIYKIDTDGAVWGSIPDIKAAFRGSDDIWYYFTINKFLSSQSSSLVDLDTKWGKKSHLLQSGISAAYYNGQELFLFAGANCITFSNVTNPEASPTINENLSLFKMSKIDGVLEIGDDIIAFSGTRYAVCYKQANGTLAVRQGYPKNINGNWLNLPVYFNYCIVGAFHAGDDFYISSINPKEDNDVFHIKYERNRVEELPCEIDKVSYHITRLTSNTTQKLSQKLFGRGVRGLLEIASQDEDELPSFQDYSGNTPVNQPLDVIYYRANRILSIPTSQHLDFTSANGNYYWEIFFHTPFLIAQTLNTAQKFNDSQKWFHHIYDPTEKTTSISLSPLSLLDDLLLTSGFKDKYQYDKTRKMLSVTGAMTTQEKLALMVLYPRANKLKDHDAINVLFIRSNFYYYWKFVLFHQDPLEYAFDAQYDKYHEDPFDPHAIANLRQIAYRKAVVMSYIDNLMDWGDMLFTQNTRESINEARMLYVLAYDLLGPRPEIEKAGERKPTQNYYQLYTEFYPDTWDEELARIENSPVNADIPDMTSDIYDSPNEDFVARGYFNIPENRQFVNYWDRVEDRLYKIRNCMTIDGIKQRLPIFAPPVDPMAMVQAASYGGGAEAALSTIAVAIPHYRFAHILAKAKEFAGHVIQVGSTLLSVLEKQDSEELALRKSDQEYKIMNRTMDVKKEQKSSAEASLEALRAGIKNAEKRRNHYGELISRGPSDFEKSQVTLMTISKLFSTMANVMETSSSIAFYIPNLGSPFAITYGGQQLGSGISGMGRAFNAISSQMDFAATLSGILGGWERRAQEWELQEALAVNDVEQINRQINASAVQVTIAQKEIDLQTEQINLHKDVDGFLKSKFTNKELYAWMARTILKFYSNSYKLALELAKTAEKAFQFELGNKESEVNFITPTYWDSLRKGLLAGEQLQYDLDRMEKSYLERNKRRFEISKTIALSELAPEALINLKNKRVCEFSFSESLFDRDFPGHYCRQIKTISISFPAIVGRNQNLNATLTQLTNRMLIEPVREGLLFLLTGEGSQPESVRSDWRPNQQIALSRGESDAGLFQLNFQDERYLPFEGTGAVSDWRLELNGILGAIDASKIQDVIIKLEYTALQGGDVFANVVKSNMPQEDGFGLILVKQVFNDQWNQFMLAPNQGLTFTIQAEHCPNMNSSNSIKEVYLQYDLTEAGQQALKDVKIKLTSPLGEFELKHGGVVNTANLAVNSEWTLAPFNASDAQLFKPDNIRNMALIVIYDTEVSF